MIYPFIGSWLVFVLQIFEKKMQQSLEREREKKAISFFTHACAKSQQLPSKQLSHWGQSNSRIWFTFYSLWSSFLIRLLWEIPINSKSRLFNAIDSKLVGECKSAVLTYLFWSSHEFIHHFYYFRVLKVVYEFIQGALNGKSAATLSN